MQSEKDNTTTIVTMISDLEFKAEFRLGELKNLLANHL